nr:MAG TPA: hypothetical protein [Caudoviricetes sp.]
MVLIIPPPVIPRAWPTPFARHYAMRHYGTGH